MSSAKPLRPVSGRGTLPAYLRDLRARQEFIRHMPAHDLHAQNMDTVLGNLWYLVNPLLLSLVYYLIFGLLLESDRGVDNYVAFLVIGVLVFNFFSQASVKASQTIGRNETLIRSLYFPRAAIPLSSTLGSFYVFLPSVLVMVVLVLVTGETPTWRWLLLPVTLGILSVFVCGSVMLLARLGHKFPDLHSLLPHLSRLLFYASGTLYDPARFTDDRRVLLLFELNPLYQLISLVRWSLLARPVPDWFWIATPAWAFGLLVVGFGYFWRGELTYGSRR